jgi:hypothetical protein
LLVNHLIVFVSSNDEVPITVLLQISTYVHQVKFLAFVVKE